jgi:hypothetical protein
MTRRGRSGAFFGALAALGVVALAAGCASDTSSPRTFANSDLELAVGNGARMACSCLFVMEMPEDYCRAWVRASPDVARISIDATAKTVEAAAFISWAAKARYVDAQRGCVLE